MSERLQKWLRSERVLSESELQAAVARQALYGGGLDTAILERGTMTETAVWARLAAATGLPAPEPALCDPSRLTMPPALDADLTGALRTVPVAVEDGTIDLLCAEPIVEADIRAAVHERGFRARLYVIPETRLFAMRQHLYGEPMPARHVPLLARAVGASEARTAYAVPPQMKKKAEGETAFLAHAATEVAPQPAPQAQSRRSPASLRHPSSPAHDPAAIDTGSTANAIPGAKAPATPLEHVLEMSGPLSVPTAAEEVDNRGEPWAEPLETMADPQNRPPRPELGCATPVEQRGSDAVPPAQVASEPGADSATEALCRRARDPSDRGRALALRALRVRLAHPATQTLLGEFRAIMEAPRGDGTKEAALVDAIEALAEMREGSVVRALVEHLDADRGSRKVAAAARRALVALTAQDFGMAPKHWRTWVESHAGRPRVEWLLQGLAHKRPEIRMSAAEDLRSLAGESFGYAFNGPKRERDAARQRFEAWWQAISRPEVPQS